LGADAFHRASSFAASGFVGCVARAAFHRSAKVFSRLPPSICASDTKGLNSAQFNDATHDQLLHKQCFRVCARRFTRLGGIEVKSQEQKENILTFILTLRKLA